MRNYIILNGKNSNTITGLLISTLPPITKPKQRTQTEEIDGRDGDIVTKLGYSAYDKEIEIGLYGNFDIDEVIAYFNTEGTVVFSNESDKYYNYQILDQIDYEKLIRFKKAKVKMHVQPFKYPLEETPVEINIQNVTNEAEEMSLDNTAEAPLTIGLKGNTSQDGTPTPEAPVEVKTVTGGQEIDIVGKNILPQNKYIATQTTNGITYTNNEDGTFNLTGTATANTTIHIIPIGEMELEANQPYYLYSSIPYNINTFNMSVVLADNGTTKYITANNTYTPTATPTNERLQFYIASGKTINATNIKIMLVKGSTAPATYEPYQSQSYEINLGKNLLSITGTSQTINGITFTVNEDGSIRAKGLASANATFISTTLQPILPSTLYRLSGCPSGGSTSTYRILTRIRSDLTTNLATISNVGSGAESDGRFTTGATAKYILGEIIVYSGQDVDLLFKPQVERIENLYSPATTYAPYKEPIELCKIGDYQDRIYKEADKWYIEKQIKKVVLDGTQNITIAPTGVRRFNANYTTLGINNVKSGSSGLDTQTKYRKCDHFSYTANVNTWGTYYLHNNWLVIFDSDNVMADANALKTWLSNNNTSIYYVLETPEVTEITDTELIGQLEAIKTARSYDPTTHISQNTANKPFIINATAVQKGTDTGIVDNEGNIYSKPTIDIEGSGIADIYLNGNQIFSIDLSIINECVINTTNLEAYNPTTNILMNRQVTGDYSNFKLNAGDNEIKISGAVTKATISNYTRWL